MAAAIRVLVIDDDPILLRLFRDSLRPPDYELHLAPGGAEAFAVLGKADPEVVVLDLNMPGMGGLEVLRGLAERECPAEVVVLTAHGTIPDAVEAMRLGARDFLTKPVSMSHLRVVLAKAAEQSRLRSENALLRRQLERARPGGEIVTRSPRMAEVLERITTFAPAEFPVLVLGETGVGKELAARAVHAASAASAGPFTAVNCGAIPETLLESELFGYERGAFTGAQARKPGLLEVANGGTLFLDEVGELPLHLQGKLLRVLETGCFFRLGGTAEIRVRVRLIAATNRDLEALAREGRFRPDLFYRISALPLAIPPLRERPEDIPLLVEHLRRQVPAFRDRDFSPGALERLAAYPWPGNVRELQNVVHRLLLLARGSRVEAADVVLAPSPAEAAGGGAQRLDDVEREHILATMARAGGHRGRAAELLGISPKTLFRKLRSYGYRG